MGRIHAFTEVLVLLSILTALNLTSPSQAECKSAYGLTACGFACVAAYGEVKCARTPQGVCTSAYGKLTCWDPQPEPSPQAATCLKRYGEVACGYGCKAAYGQVRCASRPQGVCKAAYGRVVCSD